MYVLLILGLLGYGQEPVIKCSKQQKFEYFTTAFNKCTHDDQFQLRMKIDAAIKNNVPFAIETKHNKKAFFYNQQVTGNAFVNIYSDNELNASLTLKECKNFCDRILGSSMAKEHL